MHNIHPLYNQLLMSFFYTFFRIIVLQILVIIINVDTIQIYSQPTTKLVEQMQNH